MKYSFIFLLLLGSFMMLGFVRKTVYQSNKQGCAGSSCHVYQSGIASIQQKENLKLTVSPRSRHAYIPLSAELRNEKGQIVDFQEAEFRKELTLNAPRSGDYKVYIGTKDRIPLWDSLEVEIYSSSVSIPITRYGAAAFKFLDIHPNPAKGSSILRFVIPREMDTEVVLYSMNGKILKTIFKGRLTPGLHSLQWETRDNYHRPLLPGNYLCELRADSQKLVRRIIIE